MRTRYVQLPSGEMVEKRPQSTGRADTFQVGDLPDIQKDCARWRRERAKADKQQRLQAVIDAYNKHTR
jgi:hypothetical protein